jgi:F0F1-type ATP synthase assembly protein I
MSADPSSNKTNGPSAPIGFMVAGSEMVAFTVLGLILDRAFGTMPAFTIALTLLGVVAAFFQLSRMAKAFAAKKPPKPDDEGGS